MELHMDKRVRVLRTGQVAYICSIDRAAEQGTRVELYTEARWSGRRLGWFHHTEIGEA